MAKKLIKSETENAVVVDQLKVAKKGIKKLKTDLAKFVKTKIVIIVKFSQ